MFLRFSLANRWNSCSNDFFISKSHIAENILSISYPFVTFYNIKIRATFSLKHHGGLHVDLCSFPKTRIIMLKYYEFINCFSQYLTSMPSNFS